MFRQCQVLFLDITYIWFVNNPTYDLDGAVYFLGYAQTSHTVVTSMEPQAAKLSVSLGFAFAFVEWSGSTTIQLRAGLYKNDYGKRNVRLSTKRLLSNDNNSISFGIEPTIRGNFTCATNCDRDCRHWY
jgi:hypothetical protein